MSRAFQVTAFQRRFLALLLWAWLPLADSRTGENSLQLSGAGPLEDFGPLGIVLTQRVSGLSSPVDIQNARDGSRRLFGVERGGRIRIVQGGQLLAASYLDISTTIQSGGEEGLLGLAFHPGFKTNGHFFVYHTNNNGSSNVVTRYTALPSSTNIVNQLTAVKVLEIAHPNEANHNGGALRFGFDGYLYIATGDGGSGCDPPNNSQNLNGLLGKLLRLDVDELPYAIPGDNPFVAVAGRDEIWAYGLRNPWKFSFDRLTGDLILGDVGQTAIEEVNFQPVTSDGGENYGWDCMEGAASNICAGSVCATAQMTRPVLEYTHVNGNCSITGGYRYRGTQLPPLLGRYLYGDYCTGRIWAGEPSSNGVWSTVELLDTDLNFALVSFGEDEDGELYVADISGNIFQIIAPDSDADGMADWFEQAYFGSPTVAVATSDADGDGYSNRQEFVAGTSPIDAMDRLRIVAIERIETTIQLQFQSATNRHYQIEFTDSLTSPDWRVLGNEVGTGGVVVVIDTSPGMSARHYRVRVVP